MTTFKLSLIFVQVYCSFVITKCAELENSQMDIFSDIGSTASALLPSYVTRELPAQLEMAADIEIESPPPPIKPMYTLAEHFATDLRTLLHKITQTFVKISQKAEGQRTLLHIYDVVYTVSADKVSSDTLKYLMKRTVDVMQDPNASLCVLEIVETVSELSQYNLIDWYFVPRFLYDINQNPNLIQIVEMAMAEANYINENETRRATVAALFNSFEQALGPPETTDTLRITAAAAAETADSVAANDAESAQIAAAAETAAATTAAAGAAVAGTTVTAEIATDTETLAPPSTTKRFMKRLKSLPILKSANNNV